jgi:hypothetical protein
MENNKKEINIQLLAQRKIVLKKIGRKKLYANKYNDYSL